MMVIVMFCASRDVPIVVAEKADCRDGICAVCFSDENYARDIGADVVNELDRSGTRYAVLYPGDVSL